MEYELIFYSKCSTAVKGLALLEANGIKPKIINYFNDRLSHADLKSLAQKVGSVKAIIREKTAKELGVSLEQDDDALLSAIADEPKLLQRPILIKGDKAIVGRPIEEMLKLI
ncbi:ArsC/Spx/MgsR family protein [Pseudaquidulcibacter saccharophilus]|uniref:ArsC/Spx/MgsR family protein n=1 Tax=Pseudaquidulcibacter saccharophilus TaxID=2831900 RepID=UPI001EFF21F8|nr:ArsC/Spx/MgsR family protein [Pseudaquidulcibacter saccharophilus]